MPKIQYVDVKFSAEKLALIQHCNQFLEEYRAEGFRITLRQLYYRLVATDMFPPDRKYVRLPGTNKWVRHPDGTINAEPNYNWLGELISDARMAGLIDWNSIEDRMRSLGVNSRWDTPSAIMKSAASGYQNDLWRWQPYRPEVWVEKDALVDVCENACKDWDVPFFACRGYTSQTAMWEASQRLLGYRRDRITYEGKHARAKGKVFRQKVVIFHLGDHDPSGIDMSRDIQERLELFMGEPIDFRRIALNMDQVRQYSPPPNPAKTTDSRFASYVEQFGDESWELDALEPRTLVTLIRSHLQSVMDADRFKEAIEIQEQGRKELISIADNYQDAVDAVGGEE